MVKNFSAKDVVLFQNHHYAIGARFVKTHAGNGFTKKLLSVREAFSRTHGRLLQFSLFIRNIPITLSYCKGSPNMAKKIQFIADFL